MSDLLIKMAQAATEDRTLFASYIQDYALKKSLAWDEVADSLQISPEQLAKLALCDRPQPVLFNSGIMQVADYVGMERSLLKGLVAEVEGQEILPMKQGSAQLKDTPYLSSGHGTRGVRSMFPKGRKTIIGVVVLFILLLGAFFVFAQPESVVAATLVVHEGRATVIKGNGAQETIVMADEVATVEMGDQIILEDGAAAQLSLHGGSTIDLAAGTKIDVDELVIDDATFRVHLSLSAGRTLSQVKAVLGVGDLFEISTPSSTASVRGTIFTVAYLSEDETFISCDEGKVEVTLDGQKSAMVEAGMEVTAVVGHPLVVKSQQAPGVSPTATPVPLPTATEAATATEPAPATVTATATAVETEGIEVPQPDEEGQAQTIDESGTADLLNNEPQDIPSGNDASVPSTPPEQVPGNTPEDTSGVGEPPSGGGDVPADDNGGNNGNGGNNDTGGPPEQVPGNTPEQTSGNGAPPTGGGENPGNGNGNDGGSNAPNNGGGNNSNDSHNGNGGNTTEDNNTDNSGSGGNDSGGSDTNNNNNNNGNGGGNNSSSGNGNGGKNK